MINDDKRLHGPESAPLLNPVESLPVRVTVYDKNDHIIRQETVDFSNRRHRVWIGQITAWAIQQDFVVETSKGK
jgi:hypothetical protein